MKRSILLLSIIALACNKEKTMYMPPERVNHKYSVPVFKDSAAFSNVSKYYSVIDTVFNRYARKNSFPSIAYGLVIGDKLVYANATGFANVENKKLATTKSMYRIASMTKSFTAMAILKLRDEGKLSLNDHATKYIPQLSSDRLTEDAKPITILDLLTMSAGFPEDNPWGDRQLAVSDTALIRHVEDGISYSNVPGVEFEYSNMGFAMLGYIITKVSGMPYERYISENIMTPLGMNDSKWEYTDVPEDVFAQGYRWEDNQWKPEPVLHDGAYGAMGGMICTIEDFAKYVSLHLSAWPPRNTEDNGPIKRSSIREMHQPWRLSGLTSNARNTKGEACPFVSGYGYGLGWRRNCEGTTRISHSGGLPGYGSEWRIYPEYNMGIVSFSNHTYGAPGFPNSTVLDTLIQLAGLKKRELPASDILKQRQQEIVTMLPYFKEDRIFAMNFWMDHDVASRNKEAKEIFEKAGKIIRVSELRPMNQLRGSFTIECEKKNIIVFFTLTPERDALIQQLNMELE